MQISAHVFITERYTVGVKIFGSGTRLYVTDTAKVPPTISVYPVSNKQEEGQHVLLCQAKNMFPDLVKFTWLDPKGGEVKSSDDGDEQLEQIDSVGITSMLILEKNKVTSYEYTCIVKHEGEERKQTIPTVKAVATKCVPRQETSEEETLISGVHEISRSLHLFSMTYVMLLVKNLLYFCIIFVLLYKRNSAKKEMFRVKAR